MEFEHAFFETAAQHFNRYTKGFVSAFFLKRHNKRNKREKRLKKSEKNELDVKGKKKSKK